MAAEPASSKPTPTPGERIHTAIWFAERGFGIFPVWSPLDGRCRCPLGSTCTSPGKHPITPNGFKDATRDPDKIRTFLSAGSNPNYGMLPPEGVFVWDCDTDDERARIATLEARYGPLPPTMRVSTAHGQHILWRWPEGLPRPIHKMFGMVTRWGSGAAAGYIVGPLSVHVSGKVYRSAPESATEIAELPESWARGAVEQETQTITVTGPRQPEDIAVGGRHDFLRDTARHFAGTVRDPHALFAAVWAVNQRMPVPKTQEEVQRAIGEALTRFPADPVEEDPVTGDSRRVPSGGGILGQGDQERFPDDPDPGIHGGLIGEIVASIAEYTDSSLAGLTGGMLAVCGAMVPSIGYFQRDHTGVLWLALVGESFVGRKGTTITKVLDAINDAIGIQHINRSKLGGINSGEGLVSALERRQLDAGEHGRATALIIEEEYATFLEAAAREHSTLDSRLRVAFDVGHLANITKTSAQKVTPPYWLSALIAITPVELRSKIPPTALRSGSMNRWLFLPVVRRPIVVRNERPSLPLELRKAVIDARQRAVEDRPTMTIPEGVTDIIHEYGEFLYRECVGLAADLTVRFPIMALRMAMTHAAMDRSSVVEPHHYMRGLAMTEYARSGIGWVFGHTVGDDLTTLLLRHLQDRGEMTATEITSLVTRDPVKRQRAIDELVRMGHGEVAQRQTGGRPASVLRLIGSRGTYRSFPKRDFSDFSPFSKGGQKEDGGVTAEKQKSPDPRSDSLSKSLSKSPDELSKSKKGSEDA